MKKLIIFISFCILVSYPFYTVADTNINIELSVDKSRLSINDNLELNIVMKINGNIQMEQNISVAGLENFTEVGNSVQNNMQIINGNTQQVYIFTKKLVPKSKGDFVIGPALIVVQGQQLSSNTINISVGDQASTFQTANDKALSNNIDDTKPDNLLISIIGLSTILFVSSMFLLFYKKRERQVKLHETPKNISQQNHFIKPIKDKKEHQKPISYNHKKEEEDLMEMFFSRLRYRYDIEFSKDISTYFDKLKDEEELDIETMDRYHKLYQKIHTHKWCAKKYDENELKKEINSI